MAKTREIACEHYICEGKCALGKDGTFRKQCQICKSYSAKKGGKPARVNCRKQKLEKINKNEFKKFLSE